MRMRMRRVVEEPIDQDRTELSSGAHEARGSIESWMLPTVHHCFKPCQLYSQLYTQLYTDSHCFRNLSKLATKAGC